MDETRPLSATETVPPTPRATSPLVKLTLLGVLMLLLLIPVGALLGLVHERQDRALRVRREVASTWGGEQTLGAVVLTLPYRVPSPNGLELHEIHLLPATIRWQGTVTPQVRSRGIFHVVVYEARLQATGRFDPIDLAPQGIDSGDVLWNRATLSVGLTDLRGVQDRFDLDWGGASVPFEPGSASTELLPAGLHVPLPGSMLPETAAPIPFGFELSLRGAEALRFLPLGEVTVVRLTSDWPDPGFSGSHLPRKREVGPEGFSATWEVPYFARGFPQSWRSEEPVSSILGSQGRAAAFGVEFLQTVDHYRQSERSVKYAMLFILLTFTAVFLLELVSPVRLHPMQYLLVGMALCVFYLLLLSLSEQIGFAGAYGAASVSTVTLVGLYGRSLLQSWRRAAPLVGTLIVLYGFLFSLLRAESLSLLMGATGLFAVLALVMYVTRHLDWWTLTWARPPHPPFRAGADLPSDPSPGCSEAS